MYDELIFNDCTHSKDPMMGCALEGVAGIIAGIRHVSVVIHSPQGCAATVASAYDAHEIDFTQRKTACTHLFETDIVMGATDKLEQMIREADQKFATKVMFVVGTCAADIIGEDINGLCTSLQPEIQAMLIPVVAGGFRGNKYDGMEIGLNALLPFIKKQGETIPKSVNLICPQASLNPTWGADLKWITDTLKRLGVTVQAVIAHDSTVREIEGAGRASANILLSRDAGYTFAKKLESQFGIPLILSDIPLPVGLKNTTGFLRLAGKYFEAELEAESIIKSGEEFVVDILRRRALMIIPRYRNCRAAIVADATFGTGLARMLFEDLEMIPALILLRSGSEETKNLLQREIDEMGIKAKVAFSVDGYQIKQALAEARVDAVVGSSWEMYMAKELGIKVAFDLFAPTNRDVYLDKAYFGYTGMLNMMEIMGNDWERAFRSDEIRWGQYAE
jgi:light-independent protochlorophyllide reductase B subunit